MKVEVVKRFKDGKAGFRSRPIGEVFDASAERVDELNNAGYGKLVEVIEADADKPQTIADIKAILDARGVEYKGITRKPDLEALLAQSEAQPEGDGSPEDDAEGDGSPEDDAE